MGAGMIYTLIPEKLNFVTRGSYSSHGPTTRLETFRPAPAPLRDSRASCAFGTPADVFQVRLSLRRFRSGGGVITSGPLTGKSPYDYGAHVALAVVSYEF